RWRTRSAYGAGLLKPRGKRSVGLGNELASGVFRRPESVSVPPWRETLHSPSKRGLSSPSEHFFLKATEGNPTLHLPLFLKPLFVSSGVLSSSENRSVPKACRFESS